MTAIEAACISESAELLVATSTTSVKVSPTAETPFLVEETIPIEVNVDDSATSAKQLDAVNMPLSRVQFGLVFMGLVLSIMMAALDQTIVATTLKPVVAEFGKQELVPWIGSAYLMLAAPCGILYGKMADLFGRKWVLVFALVIFELGSIICAISNGMEMLIVGRAVAGVGGGGIFSLVNIIISDLVSLQDRGKHLGMVGAVFAAASVIGPLVGGAFSDYVTWRWCFYVNVPLGCVTVISIIAFLKSNTQDGTFTSKLAKVDFLGAFFVFAAMICFVTPIQLGGSIWPWASAQTIMSFILSLLFLAIVVQIELRIARQPIVPASLFISPSIPALLIISFCAGACFFTSIYYIALFFEVVNGDSATNAGVKTIPTIFGGAILLIGSGIFISKTGNYKIFFVLGPAFLFIGFPLVSSLDRNSYLVQKVCYLIIAGMGSGCLIQNRLLGLHAHLPNQLMAIGTAVSSTCFTLGGTVGVSIAGTLFNNLIRANYFNYPALFAATAALQSNGIMVDPTQVLSLQELIQKVPGIPNPDQANADLISVFTLAFKDAYLSLLAYPILVLLCTVFVSQGKGGSNVTH